VSHAARYELVIFDCDGVLVDSEGISNRILAECLSAIGVPTTPESSMRDYMGRSWRECVPLFEARLGAALPHDFETGYRARLSVAFREELREVPGIRDALARIPTRTCVASSGGHDKMQLTLGQTGLYDRFAGRIFSAVEVARAKPFPDLFLYAAQSLGVEPGRCAVVEDSPRGVEAGVAAGMAVFGYAARTASESLAALGARVFRDMRALPALLGFD
jgi:HAD superfamily hydrolase (TIGR01509 family)